MTAISVTGNHISMDVDRYIKESNETIKKLQGVVEQLRGFKSKEKETLAKIEEQTILQKMHEEESDEPSWGEIESEQQPAPQINEQYPQKPTELSRDGETTPSTRQPGFRPIGLGARPNRPTNQISIYRPAPINFQKRTELQSNPPPTIKETLQTFSSGECALVNWVSKRLVLIGEEKLLERVLSRMATHNVHSFPVIGKEQKIIGMISIVDVISALIDSTSSGDRPIQINIRRDFLNREVSSLLLPNKSKTYLLSNSETVFHAAQQMIRTNQERFLIVNRNIEEGFCEQTEPESKVIGIITQSDILKFLVQNVTLMKREPLFQKTLKELGLGNRSTKIIPWNDITIDAFKSLGTEQRTGAAIVDQFGKLIGNLSISDLKGVNRRNCPILQTTVFQYLSRDQRRGWWVRPVYVDLNETLFQTILQFVSLKLHRLYVVDSQFRPIGEIIQRDILEIICQNHNH